jgi:hypothetical protein
MLFGANRNLAYTKMNNRYDIDDCDIDDDINNEKNKKLFSTSLNAYWDNRINNKIKYNDFRRDKLSIDKSMDKYISQELTYDQRSSFSSPTMCYSTSLGTNPITEDFVNQFILIFDIKDDIDLIYSIELMVGGEVIETIDKTTMKTLKFLFKSIIEPGEKIYFPIPFLSFNYLRPFPCICVPYSGLNIKINFIKYLDGNVSLSLHVLKNIHIHHHRLFENMKRNNMGYTSPDLMNFLMKRSNILKKIIGSNHELPVLRYQTNQYTITSKNDLNMKLNFSNLCFGFFMYFENKKQNTDFPVDILGSLTLYINGKTHIYDRKFLLFNSYKNVGLTKYNTKIPLYFVPISGINPFRIDDTFKGSIINFDKVGVGIKIILTKAEIPMNYTLNIMAITGNVLKIGEGCAKLRFPY